MNIGKIATTVLLVISATAASAQLSRAVVDKELGNIEKRNSPRYLQYRHDDICREIGTFVETNDIPYDQRIYIQRRLAYHALFLEDGALYDQTVGQISACTNQILRTNEQTALINAFLHIYRGGKEYRAAEKIFAQIKNDLTPQTRVDVACKFAQRAMPLFMDYNLFLNYFKVVEGEQEAAMQIRVRATLEMLKALNSFDRSAAQKLFDERSQVFSPAQRDDYYVNLANAMKSADDRAGFDKILNRFKAYPLAQRIAPYSRLIEILNGFDPKTASALIDSELKNKTLSPEQRTAYLSTLRNMTTPPVFNYGFNDPLLYGRFRETLRQQLAIEQANPTNKECQITKQHWIMNAAERVWWYDDLALAEELINKHLAHYPQNGDAYALRARIHAAKGDRVAAVSDLRARLACPRYNSAQATNETLPLIAFLEGKGVRDFEKFAEQRKMSLKERAALLRKTSRTLFNMRQYDTCHEIFNEIVKNLYSPETPKIHKATFMADVPKSADSFARTPALYNDFSKMETRFVPYGDGYGESSSTDEQRHLRDAPKQSVSADYKTAIRVLYDTNAAHFFIRCDDKNISDIASGRRTDAGSLEIVFRPGGDVHPYHSIFMNDLPGVDDPHKVEWGMPGKHYSLSTDIFKKEAVLTQDGVVAHITIPWEAFFHALPVNGTNWRFGVIRSTPDGMQSSGGIVHELSRSINVQFDFTAQQLTAIKKNIAIKTYCSYRTMRNDRGKMIQNWNDSELGDPEFYAAVVAPLVEELDKAGEALLAPAPDGEIDAIFQKYVPLWSKINYEIAQRRVRYLHDRWLME